MLTRIDRITYRNGFRLNGEPVSAADIEPVFECRRSAALSLWEQYEQRKAELYSRGLSQAEYQRACRQIADALGV
ncbi:MULTISPECIES: hypothetical protein [Brenneria]|uniref:Adenylate cyclase n=1 Tax=Brenneria nigrifluens DSM 30175 = ATCC 13028 TaxID=1121120 RepID=A0A2U1UUR8_9GAMM|nr:MULTISPECIES: hypothetical protein [Brenneria]EHD22096.1 hypothetical protein BrE312_2720 [Brenneria sp. EniD312]PWC25426.1 hypothetical protein DDT54_05890 [Brenneria nigrifluens DSM 30175 = ATCC 13028]QCR05176.1 hypothetical protein EH206_13845 [Brenneria nigrifluens DSM 30175 = ATCC 13028]